MGVGANSNPALFHALSHAPGHKYLIGEKGPEGVVPAQYLPKFLQSRHGQAAVGGNLAAGAKQDGWGAGGPLGLPNRQVQAAMRTPLAGSTMDGGAMGVGTDITAMAGGGEIGMPSDTNPYQDDPNSPYHQLQSAGDVPPFLSRAMGQQQGQQAYGTNVPQKAYLPPNLPLESQYGYDQMSPSEQQALQSYASSMGISPEDYLAQMRGQVAPARRRQHIEYEAK